MADDAGAQRSLGTEGFERKEIDLFGVKTVYYEAGEGPTVVYFHGGGAFHGFQLARPWTRKFRVICPHHPGFGESGDDPRVGGMQHYVLHYLDFFDRLDLGRVHLAGASMGGRLAAEFAVSHAERLKSLILAAPAGLDVPEHPPANLGAVGPGEFFALLTNNMAFLSPFLPPAVPVEAFAAARAREGQSAGKVMMSPSSLDHWMHRITVPVLIVWGKEDRVLPVGRVQAWIDRLPKTTTLHVFDDIGHLTFDESPEAVGVAEDFMLGVERGLRA